MHVEMPPVTGYPRRPPLPGRVLEVLKRRLLGAHTASPRQYEGEMMHYQRGRFAIIGDLQSTSRIEFWRKPNTRERVQLIRQIATETPDFLAIVGDLVFRGSSATHWAGFDQLTTPLCHARVPILPLLGNHDYGIRRRPALAHFFRRFPHLGGRHWFSRIYGPLGMIFLDSNRGRLPAAQWREQIGWYKHEIQRFERMAEIRGVLVLVHHPPYTNSPLTPDDRVVQRAFVPPFVQARKTLLMVSGHVHSYERFVRADKTFVVTGGGGPRVKLATGRRRRHTDDCFGGPPLRGFHFLMLTPLPTQLEIEMRGLHQHGGAFDTLDRFALPWVSSPM
jgi:Calcineurin-like phosphoesterase